jgi:hypothetical protein
VLNLDDLNIEQEKKLIIELDQIKNEKKSHDVYYAF